jgi:hypothetical protein
MTSRHSRPRLPLLRRAEAWLLRHRLRSAQARARAQLMTGRNREDPLSASRDMV